MTVSANAVDVKSCCAGFYELPIVSMLLGDNLHPGGAALTRKLAEAAVVGGDSSVLDVACGRGESARVLAMHRGCRVVGIDYSRENISRARELAREAELAENVDFLHGDVEQLPFRSETFDVVISECSLCTFPRLETALAEIRRVLRPGGRVGISDVVLNGKVPDSLQDLVGHVLCITGARSTDGYGDTLRAAGFTAIRTRDVSYVLTDMIGRIDRRLDMLQSFVAPEQIELADGLIASRPKLAKAREFVVSGGAGYALMTARKPRGL